MRVHKRGIHLNFVVLRVQTLHNLKLVVIYTNRGPLKIIYNILICIVVSLWHKCFILEETTVNILVISSSYWTSWMYGGQY